jgi:hypothetical protein
MNNVFAMCDYLINFFFSYAWNLPRIECMMITELVALMTKQIIIKDYQELRNVLRKFN